MHPNWRCCGSWRRSWKRDAASLRQQHPAVDYNFHVENDPSSENARVTITNRRRGSPIDKVVSELMILVNSEWGKHIAEHGFVAIYRTSRAAR